MSAAPKERRGHYTAPKINRVKGAYQFPHFLQPFGNGTNGEVKGGAADVFHQRDERCCVRCRAIVTNENLGGHSRESAFVGALWCYDCC